MIERNYRGEKKGRNTSSIHVVRKKKGRGGRKESTGIAV
jgi:hypothetical protein